MGRTSSAKEKLTQTAARLMHAKGYSDTGVQEICDAAGVNKGSFYHFFPSKEDLALAVLDQHWEAARTQYWRLAFSRDIAPLDRLRRFFHMASYYFQEMLDRRGEVWGCPFGNAALELSSHNKRVSAKISEIFDDAETHVRQCLEEAVRQGDLQLDPAEAAEALWAYYEGVLLVAKARQDPALIRKLSKSALDFLRSRSPNSR